MLESISLENFRSYKKLKDFELKPITVLCGTNSSGKSTIIKSILLWKQSLLRSQRDFAFNGELVKLGDPKNLPFNDNKDNAIKFKFIINTFKCSRNYKNLIRDIAGAILKPGGRDGDYELNFTIKLVPNPSSDLKVDLIDYHLNIKKIKVDAEFSDYVVKSPKTTKSLALDLRIWRDSDSKTYSVSWKNLSNHRRYRRRPRSNGRNEDENLEIKKGFKRGAWNNLTLEFFSILQPGLSLVEATEIEFEIGRELTLITEKLETLLYRIFFLFTYLGPIRGEPRRRIFDEGEVTDKMGMKGENAAMIYDRHKSDRIKFYYFDSVQNEFLVKNTTLRIAAEHWLSELGVHNFKIRKYEHDTFSFNMNASEFSDHKVSIADVGFGVSQVFPIIIHGLLMAPVLTLMIEQPELHLHPKMQMKLADFFLSMALTGKKLIIETHSEHIINRLVRRVVEETDNKFNPLVGINFVTKTKNGSKIEKIELSETDGIVNWPDEFFDQAADEQQKILTAIIQKK